MRMSTDWTFIKIPTKLFSLYKFTSSLACILFTVCAARRGITITCSTNTTSSNYDLITNHKGSYIKKKIQCIEWSCACAKVQMCMWWIRQREKIDSKRFSIFQIPLTNGIFLWFHCLLFSKRFFLPIYLLTYLEANVFGFTWFSYI